MSGRAENIAKRVSTTQWYTPVTRMDWTLQTTIGAGDLTTTPFPPGYLWTYTWRSATFDLCPELGDAQSPSINVQPVWDKDARLFIQIYGDAAGSGAQPVLNTGQLNAVATEFVNTTTNEGGAGSGLQQLSRTNVSWLAASFSPGTAALIGFAPPGNTLGFSQGHPVRYWRVQIIFTFMVETGLPLPAQQSPTSFAIQAALY